MTMTDPIADMLTRVRNANRAYHETTTMPHSKIKVGIAEILVGEVTGSAIRVATTTVARTPSAKEVVAVERRFVLEDDDTLSYEVHMASVGQPMQLHLAATLRRVGAADGGPAEGAL